MDLKTLHKISYGMYIVSSRSPQENKINGQIANTVFQITSEPPTIAVSINQQNLTHGYIKESKVLTVSILTTETPLSLIGTFGFKSGRDMDKFAEVRYRQGQNTAPIVEEYCLGYLEGEVIRELDLGSHTLFIARVTEAAITRPEEEPMTYAYYHTVKKGGAPKTAPTYLKETNLKETKEEKQGMDKYVCSVCGYVYDPAVGDPDSDIEPGTAFEDIPDDWVCPVCGVGKDQFEKEE